MKNMNKISQIIAIITTVLLVVLAMIPKVFLPTCGPMPNGKFMSCHYSGNLVLVVALILAIINILTLLFRKYWTTVVASVLTIISLISVYLIGFGRIKVHCTAKQFFGLCKSPSMPCHHSFHYVAWIITIVVIIGIVQLIWTFLSKSKRG